VFVFKSDFQEVFAGVFNRQFGLIDLHLEGIKLFGDLNALARYQGITTTEFNDRLIFFFVCDLW